MQVLKLRTVPYSKNSLFSKDLKVAVPMSIRNVKTSLVELAILMFAILLDSYFEVGLGLG